jgi:hypothetical protein
MNYDNHYTDKGTGNAQAETEATSGDQSSPGGTGFEENRTLTGPVSPETSRQNPILRRQRAPRVHPPADPFRVRPLCPRPADLDLPLPFVERAGTTLDQTSPGGTGFEENRTLTGPVFPETRGLESYNSSGQGGEATQWHFYLRQRGASA